MNIYVYLITKLNYLFNIMNLKKNFLFFFPKIKK